ncbi:hypothetical protein E4U43_004850 [Claviceps pusilla]|uniref:Uncharacterized protein n=1 Tax=Claviceps pusilla TaxID=123648 RepID=A0A9P7N5K4_9HYPO|nr:hypothetical protein E4U43_004850 [Claviceps pusilla]
MEFQHPCPAACLVDPTNPEQFPSFQTTSAPSSNLYFIDEFGYPIPLPELAIYPDPGFLCDDSPMPDQLSCSLIPHLHSELLAWPSSESYMTESWAMDLVPPASSSSDPFELEPRDAMSPALMPASSSSPFAARNHAEPGSQVEQQVLLTHLPAADSTPPEPDVHVAPKDCAPREPSPSLLPPLTPHPNDDHTPPYMTPRAIKARELILQCDFPKDTSPNHALKREPCAQNVRFLNQ